MGTFETAIVNYHSLLADQGKLSSFSVSVYKKYTEVFHFRFPFAENKRKFPFSFSSVFNLQKYEDMDMEIETWKHRDMVTWRWKHGEPKGKQKTEAHVIFSNLFTVCSSCKRKFVVCNIVEKEKKEFIRLQTD
jgi:hypothetical protein